MKNLIYTIACLGITLTMHAQDVLTLDDAFTLAIENNFDIKIEKQNLQIAETNANRGNAGYYPNLAANGSYDHSYSNTKVEYDFSSSGGMSAGGQQSQGNSVSEGTGVNSQTYQAGIGIDYKLYEGNAKKYRYRELISQKEISSLALKAQIEKSFIEVANAYMEVARAQTALELAMENAKISEERVARAEIDQKFGSATGLRYLQSVTFLNNDSIELKSTKVQLINAKRSLNHVLGRSPDTEVKVIKEVELMPEHNFETLWSQAKESNTMICMANEKLNLSENYLSLAKSSYAPTLSLTGNYGYYRQENEQNLIVSNENLGFSGNVTLSIPIYTGNKRKTQVQTSKLRIQQEQYSQEKTILEIQTELSKNFEMYSFFLQQLKTEQDNIQLYERNFEKASSDYMNGLTNSTEVREAQKNLVAAKNRISSLQYSIKVYEIILMQISGELVENY